MRLSFIILQTCLLLCLVACNKEKTIEKPKQITKADYFKENVSFIDARLRNMGNNEMVRELVLIDFSKEGKMPASVIFDGTTLFDDGSYNDTNANDGIYTSAAKFTNQGKIRFSSTEPIQSVMEESIIDKRFKYADRLFDFLKSEYSVPKSGSIAAGAKVAGPVATLECDVEFGTCGCRADNWGWCDCCCVTVSNCKGKVGWE